MARPESLRDCVTLVRQCGLIEPDRLELFLSRLNETDHLPEQPTQLLSRLIKEGLLTPYQAREIQNGNSESLRLGPYRVLNLLGRGGMGRVYLCEHSRLNRLVAVKVLSSGLQTDVGARRRFAREARAAAALDHENVVRVFDIEATSEPPYIVMEYVDGMSWQAAVVRFGPLSPGEVAHCGMQAARGLQGIADAGLIHRDIKPANLLLDRKGQIKILDLGIVRIINEASITLESNSRNVLGTLDYLAPEQAVDSSTVDIRADLYALGSTLYFLLVGQPPFPDGEVEEKVGRKLSLDPPRLQDLNPDIPPALACVIERLLARHPEDRFATPAEAAAALEPLADIGEDFPDRLFRPLDSSLEETPCPPRVTIPAARAISNPPEHATEALDMNRMTAVLQRPNSNRSGNAVRERIDFDIPPTMPLMRHEPVTGRFLSRRPLLLGIAIALTILSLAIIWLVP